MTTEHAVPSATRGNVIELSAAEQRSIQEGTATERLNALLALLAARGGQDLHLSAGVPPCFRLHGEIVRLPLPALTPEDTRTWLGGMLTPEQREVFGRGLELDFAVTVPGSGRFRCNMYQQRGSLALTARHLHETVPTAEQLHLPRLVHDAALQVQGLILVTGPNGHGKSTTLASMVDTINRERSANIITIEDPIEYHFAHARSNVNQREVGTDTRSFAEGLRRVVRQNPDVIVIGELRDHESIATALSAAETGHLVMATMHALSSTSAVDRILDFFTGDAQAQVRAQLAESLLLVFAQRLVRKADGSGRLLAWESMSGSLRVKNAIRDGKTHVLRSLAQGNQEDLVPMEKSLAELVGSGQVRREEALRYTANADYLDDLVRARRERRAQHE